MMRQVEYRAAPDGYPVADQIMMNGVCLPCHPTMTEEDRGYLYEVLEKWLSEQRQRN
jgi:CDP-6-deoxy-D-xylo-4-hexulose-3-dehydrase